MPYIKQNLRKEVDAELQALINKVREISDKESIYGILNYCILTLILETVIGSIQNTRYFTINGINGLLTSIIQEFNRRIADNYENKKIAENGDLAILEDDPAVKFI